MRAILSPGFPLNRGTEATDILNTSRRQESRSEVITTSLPFSLKTRNADMSLFQLVLTLVSAFTLLGILEYCKYREVQKTKRDVRSSLDSYYRKQLSNR